MKIEMELEEEQEVMEVEDVVMELGETNLDDDSPDEVRVWPLYPHQSNVDCRVMTTMTFRKRMLWQRKKSTNSWETEGWMRNKRRMTYFDHLALS